MNLTGCELCFSERLPQVTQKYMWIMMYEKKGKMVTRKLRLILMKQQRLFQLPPTDQVGPLFRVSPAEQLSIEQ